MMFLVSLCRKSGSTTPVQAHKNTVRQITVRAGGKEAVDQDNEKKYIGKSNDILARFAKDPR